MVQLQTHCSSANRTSLRERKRRHGRGGARTAHDHLLVADAAVGGSDPLDDRRGRDVRGRGVGVQRGVGLAQPRGTESLACGPLRSIWTTLNEAVEQMGGPQLAS